MAVSQKKSGGQASGYQTVVAVLLRLISLELILSVGRRTNGVSSICSHSSILLIYSKSDMKKDFDGSRIKIVLGIRCRIV